MFEGKTLSAMEAMEKIRKDVLEWKEAQVVEFVEGSNVEITASGITDHNESRKVVKWQPPPIGWLKCNIGLFWSKKNRLVGGA